MLSAGWLLAALLSQLVNYRYFIAYFLPSFCIYPCRDMKTGWSMSTMMAELQTPVDLAILLLSLLSKRSIIELFPETGGPITMECAGLLLILPLLAIASSMAVMNCCESALYLSSPKVRVKMTKHLLFEMLQLHVQWNPKMWTLLGPMNSVLISEVSSSQGF